MHLKPQHPPHLCGVEAAVLLPALCVSGVRHRQSGVQRCGQQGAQKAQVGWGEGCGGLCGGEGAKGSQLTFSAEDSVKGKGSQLTIRLSPERLCGGEGAEGSQLTVRFSPATPTPPLG